jgi:hypothetical protein
MNSMLLEPVRVVKDILEHRLVLSHHRLVSFLMSSLNLSITARRALNPTSLIFERSVNTAGSAPAS